MMQLTPDPCKKVGMGITPSPSPFFTPRPERRRLDVRPEWNSNRPDRDKEVNVQVLLRCRPLSEEEQRANVPKAITCNEQRREVTVMQNLANKQVDRIFTFDKVFGPKAQQRTIYDQAIAPIVNEVLDGFNCTVFAYGQTGTGKTYTMEGGMRNKGGDLPAESGVIPRAVRQIFETLEAQNADYSMKVTFLELYNEEITDLLAPDENSRSLEDKQIRKPVSLLEDGKGCVVVRGLEEEAVYSANEIYNLLERGSGKRRTADTLLNKRSSRSHSVFSITLYIKEAAVGDEELIKCGKLNLVDLAGSENISRSGSREGRAREAGEINKSLLTLGRVINALVEHTAHIPYRDSKLTRLLRDSLGGKTKACIIATISPSAHFLEETLSTLDYAYRAKNIKNKPEANQKMSKAVLLKDLYLEIEKMKEDVRAARDKNGVYIPHERYVQEEAEKKARIEKIEQLENDLSHSERQVESFRELYLSEQEQKLDVEKELKHCKINLEKSNKAFIDLQENHRAAILKLKEKELIISKLLHSENALIERAKELRSELQNASEDLSSLFTKLDDKNKMEAENRSMVLTFGSQLDQRLRSMHKTVLGSISQQQQQLRCMEELSHSFLASRCDATNALEHRVKNMKKTYSSGVSALKELASLMQKKASSDLEQINSAITSQIAVVEEFVGNAVSEAQQVLEDMQNSLNVQKEMLAFSAHKQEEALQRSVFSAQEISKVTADFLADIHNQASEFMAMLEERQMKKFQQLTIFEKTFKAEAEREEKQALEQITAILANLTSKKTATVLEASRNIKDTDLQENKMLEHQMSMMQQISTDANQELSKYSTKVEQHFIEDTFLAAEFRAFMEDHLQDCSNIVNCSKQLWENTQSRVKEQNISCASHIESTVKENIGKNNTINQESASAFSSLNAGFDYGTEEIRAVANESLDHDRISKKEMDSLTSTILVQLKTMQEQHSQGVSNIRTEAEKCLVKDYLVDQHSSTLPKKRVMLVPSLESIEEMRTPSLEKHKGDDGSRWGQTGIKIQAQMDFSPNRTPFAHVN